MRRRAPLLAVALAALAAFTGCQSADVGQPCNISWGADSDSAPTPTTAAGDYFETGNLACDGLVCIVSPVTPDQDQTYATGGYCSKPCISDSECYSSETGLVCRQMLLDPVFLEQLDLETRQRYVSDVQFSSYCAVER